MTTPLLPDALSAALFDQAPFSAVLYDPDGRVLAVNAAFTELFGLTFAQIPADYNIRTDPQLDERRVLPLVERAFAGERITLPPLRYDGTAHDPGGRVTWTQAQLFPIRDDAGALIRVVLFHTDLTERLRSEEMLRTAQQDLNDERLRLEAILNGVAHGVTVQDVTGRIIYANDMAAVLCGFTSAGELLAAGMAEIMGRFEMLDEQGALFPVDRMPGRRALAGEDDAEALMQYRLRATGLVRWSLVRARALTLADGTRIVVNVFQDVTERMEEQRRLEWAEERASFLAEAGKVLASSLDYNRTLKDLTQLAVPRICDWCSLSMVVEDGSLRRLGLVHRDPARLALAEELERRYPAPPETSVFNRVVRTGRSELFADIPPDVLEAAAVDAGHLELLRQVGLVSMMVVPLAAHGRVLGALAFVAAESGRHYDASDLRFAESLAERAALTIHTAELYQQAQEANRAKSNFLAVMSHELRTPLNAILGYADLLDAEVSGELNDAQRAQLSRIGQSAQHLTQLIDTVLSFARIDAGREEIHLTQAEVGHVATEAAALLEPAVVRKGLRLVCRIEHHVVCRTDVARLRQILLNLLSNAVKFTDAGAITVTVERSGGAALIHVQDTGVGMEAGDLDRIWQPFTRLDATLTRNTGGTGLGLSVSANLAELIGARISVTSEPGVGSTFTITLPLENS